MYRESGVAIDLLARVNNGNVTNIGYQALLRISITVTGALLHGQLRTLLSIRNVNRTEHQHNRIRK